MYSDTQGNCWVLGIGKQRSKTEWHTIKSDADDTSMEVSVRPPLAVAVSGEQAMMRRQWFEGRWTVGWDNIGQAAEIVVTNAFATTGEVVSTTLTS
jgi:hypothetical protein